MMSTKRLLNENEIEYILDFIELNNKIPLETALCIRQKHVNSLKKQLINELVYPEIIPKLKEELEKQYYNSLINIGESIGIIAAQSIGEKNTQQTLNTFHKAGLKNAAISSGVPRFQELLNATKNPKIINHKIYFKKNTNLYDMKKMVGHKIIGFKISDISTSINVIMNKKKEKWYESFSILQDVDLQNLNHCVQIKFCKNKLYEYRISLSYICKKIKETYSDLICIFSPLNKSQIDIFAEMGQITMPENISNIDNIRLYLEEVVQIHIKNIIVTGISGINEIFWLKEENEWIIDTNADTSYLLDNGFKKILRMNIVDFKRTISNNVWDIYYVLGIEAAREFLITELKSIMDGISECHVKLLVDRICFNGTISSISRYTLKKSSSGPIAKASFEETLENILSSAANSSIEQVKGASASILCGKQCLLGTGFFKVGLDFEKLIGE